MNRHFHLESGISSRVEGAHSCLKSYIGNSLADLLVVKEQMSLVISNQLEEFKLAVSNQQIKVPTRMDQNFFHHVARKVSIYALNLVMKNYCEARTADEQDPLPTCYGRTRAVLGLPCAHEIKRMLEDTRLLQLGDFHTHWHLLKPDVVAFVPPPLFVQVRNPAIVVGRGRPVGAENRRQDNDVRRDRVGFEIAEAAANGRKCGRCGQRGTGHNIATYNVIMDE